MQMELIGPQKVKKCKEGTLALRCRKPTATCEQSKRGEKLKDQGWLSLLRKERRTSRGGGGFLVFLWMPGNS